MKKSSKKSEFGDDDSRSFEEYSSETSSGSKQYSQDDVSGKQPPSWVSGEAGGGDGTTLVAPPHGGHKARQKKFHRHFPQASQDERVLNYYSCALVGDILLQGHLYITKNYFAFYSNVFGYVTKLLIPLSSVVHVSKEKMARIIPNAVGVTTIEDKHVFGSLLSRDTTFNLMTQVLKASNVPVTEPLKELRITKGESELSLDDDSSCCSQSGEDTNVPRATQPTGPTLPPPSPKSTTDGLHQRAHRDPSDNEKGLSVSPTIISRKSSGSVLVSSSGGSRKKGRPTLAAVIASSTPAAEPKSHSLLLVVAIAVLLMLLVLAGLLLYRIFSIRVDMDDNVLLLKRGDDVYSQILKWHSQLHSKSAMQVHEFLHSNLDQIAKVRQSLETLSTLIGGIITDKMGSAEGTSGSYIGRSGDEHPRSTETIQAHFSNS